MPEIAPGPKREDATRGPEGWCTSVPLVARGPRDAQRRQTGVGGRPCRHWLLVIRRATGVREVVGQAGRFVVHVTPLTGAAPPGR
jgi:hypothetical protein